MKTALTYTKTVSDFKEKLAELPRHELLEMIRIQNPQFIKHINRIEYVFKEKLKHLTWEDGSPVEGRQITNQELISLIDPPFIFDRNMAKMGFNEEQQRQLHIALDPVLWARNFLGLKPRAYQVLVLRNPNHRKVMRMGRRLGKSYTLALTMLWYAYTNPNAKIIIVAPMKSQVGLIYEAVMEHAEKSKVVSKSITRHVTSPQYEINMSNGSSMRFFTTGMKSNGKADVTRGQEADILILDEMDYMGPDDLIALMAMMQKTDENKTSEKMILAASTPTGQHNMFYNWCSDPRYGFSSFWFPSLVNPNWDKEMEAQMKIDYPTELAYAHEIEAAWGEDADGVYPQRFVKQAFIDFTNEGETYPRDRWYYQMRIDSARSFFVMGVDWDKYGAGVNVVVLEACQQDYEDERYAGKIRLAYREEISKGENTYMAAIDRIIELNAFYKFKHIYVDRGSGEVQIELLHKYGMENPASKLQKTIKGWQFGESIEVKDPFTKQPVKKELKPFMVNNLASFLEKNRIVFPDSDEDLFMQLISYVVARTSSISGRPVFAMTGNVPDHAHDALILACFAITDNYDELMNPIFASKSIAVSNEAFLPNFHVDSSSESNFATEKWGNNGPVYKKRTFTHNVRGTKSIRRKMF